MQQIESINKRIELDRKEINKELISDVLELKARINENKKSLELPKKEELKPLPLKVEKPSPVSMPSSEVLKEDDIERQKRMMDIINESFSLPKLYDNKVREEILSMPELDFSLAQVNVELEKEKKEKSEKIPTSVKLRKKIPAKAFLNLDDFDFLLNEIVQLKMALSSDYHEISHELLKKEHLDRELLSIDQNLGVIKETFSKINSNFPFRGKQ
jgi:hypothetical protein